MLPRLLLGLLIALPLLPAMALASPPTPYLSAEVVYTGGTAFLRGSTRIISGIIRKCANSVPGCPTSFQRSTIYFRLPPGIHYVSHSTYAPVFPATCTTSMMPDGAEHVACTGGGLSTGIYNVGQITLTVAVALDAPIGLGRLVIGVDDSLPAESGTLAGCIVDSLPNYCVERNLPIEAAAMADLYIQQANHSPLVFQPDEVTSRITIYLVNQGNAPTSGTHMQAHLPAGFEWQLATTTTNGLAMTCSSTGSWQTTGQTVTCSGGALAASGSVDVKLGIRPRDNIEVPGPVPVVGAVNQGASADPAVLAACASDSSPAHCIWHNVQTWIPCARSRDTGIFCDSFDVPFPTAVPPPAAMSGAFIDE